MPYMLSPMAPCGNSCGMHSKGPGKQHDKDERQTRHASGPHRGARRARPVSHGSGSGRDHGPPPARCTRRCYASATETLSALPGVSGVASVRIPARVAVAALFDEAAVVELQDHCPAAGAICRLPHLVYRTRTICRNPRLP